MGSKWTTYKYGISSPVKISDLELELYAFRNKLTISEGGLGVEQHFRNAANLLWPSLQWNPWLEEQIDSLCKYDYVGWAGCGACVRGDTRIEDPIRKTARTIEDLCNSRVAPYVMTLSGPVLATVPFVKGFDDLYEVVLENGSRFTATANHRVLSKDGDFYRVSDLQIGSQLLGYSPSRPRSISGLAPSIRASNESHSTRTAPGFQCDCPACSSSCGERFPSGQGVSQCVSPSRSDALGHTQLCSCADDLAPSQEHSRSCQSCAPLSSWDSFPQGNHSETPWSVHAVSDEPAQYCLSSQPSSQSWLETSQTEPVGLLDRDFGHRHFSSCPEYAVQPSKVSRISWSGRHLYYDLCVPDVHHYFAEGAIHHNSGKTYSATLFSVVWWCAHPTVSTVLLTSTTAKMIRKRMWANVQELTRKVVGFPGNMVDSKMSHQAVKGDDRHSISAIAVADGNTSKAVANIQGIHAERVMVIIDEATDTPEAAFEACTNLSKGCREFKMLVIGNPSSKFDPHGRFCTPAKGWRSVDVSDLSWETERGICVRFDGLESPNMSYAKPKYKYLITREQVETAVRHETDSSPTFWKFTRGFWAPEGTVKTVLSESMIDTYEPGRTFTFITSSTLNHQTF